MFQGKGARINEQVHCIDETRARWSIPPYGEKAGSLHVYRKQASEAVRVPTQAFLENFKLEMTSSSITLRLAWGFVR